MISDILQPTHLLFVLVVALLVLGPKRLPEAGRALGKGLRDFRSAISGEEDHHTGIPPAATATAAPMPPPEASVPPMATAPMPSHEAVPVARVASAPPAEASQHPAEAAEEQTAHPVG